jgi:hypothetical protein
MRTKQETLRSAMFAPFDLILNLNQSTLKLTLNGSCRTGLA